MAVVSQRLDQQTDSIFNLDNPSLNCNFYDFECNENENEDKDNQDSYEETVIADAVKIQKDIKSEINNTISKNLGWSLLQYGRIHVIGPKQEEEDRHQLRIEKQERRRLRKLAKAQRLTKPSTVVVKSLFCQNPESVQSLRLCELVAKIAPPREFKSRGIKLRQYVSCQIATRRDVIALKDRMEKELKKCDSLNEDGMCHKRRLITNYLFDELIRQCTVNCLERGKLLLFFRDEIYSQFNYYEKLFYSRIGHGIGRVMRTLKNIEQLQKNITQVKQEIEVLEEIKQEFIPVYQHYESKFTKEQEEDDVMFKEKIEKLTKTNALLKGLLLRVVQEQKPGDEVIAL